MGMNAENGVGTAAQSFSKNLPIQSLRCDIIPTELAVWRYEKTQKKSIQLSSKAVSILVAQKKINVKDLKL